MSKTRADANKFSDVLISLSSDKESYQIKDKEKALVVNNVIPQ